MVVIRTKGRSGVYQILNLNNGKRYIGSSVNLEKRGREHFSALQMGCHCSSHLQNAWNKYGKNNFEFSILRICPKQKLIVNEQEFLDFYNSFDPRNGYNTRSIADSNFGIKRSDICRRRLSESHKNKSLSQDHKYSISKGVKETIQKRGGPWNKGQSHDEKTKRKIGDASKGRKLSKETKQKMSEAKKGKRHSEETKQKMSEAVNRAICRHDQHWNKGRVHTQETRRINSEVHKGQGKGKRLSEEHKRKISEAKKKKYQSVQGQ